MFKLITALVLNHIDQYIQKTFRFVPKFVSIPKAL